MFVQIFLEVYSCAGIKAYTLYVYTYTSPVHCSAMKRLIEEKILKPRKTRMQDSTGSSSIPCERRESVPNVLTNNTVMSTVQFFEIVSAKLKGKYSFLTGKSSLVNKSPSIKTRNKKHQRNNNNCNTLHLEVMDTEDNTAPDLVTMETLRHRTDSDVIEPYHDVLTSHSSDSSSSIDSFDSEFLHHLRREDGNDHESRKSKRPKSCYVIGKGTCDVQQIVGHLDQKKDAGNVMRCKSVKGRAGAKAGGGARPMSCGAEIFADFAWPDIDRRL